MPATDIQTLVENAEHPVVERYYIAFINFIGGFEDCSAANRNELLMLTLDLDISGNIKLRHATTEWFDAEGCPTDIPEDWVAQELLGFLSTYPCVTIEQVIADIQAYDEDVYNWPFPIQCCRHCRMPRFFHPDGFCTSCYCPSQD